MPSTEELKATYLKAQAKATKAYEELQEALHPEPTPDSEVMIYHTRGSYVTMTIKDLALALKVPVSEILDPDVSVKYAASAIEHTIQNKAIPEWFEQNEPEIDEDHWSVTLQRP